ncbi:SHOCT domain-containing protein [Xanthomonas sacchari]|uniref:SHOCT domain-containing protein n=1 Tax=Xanthomonas sacchari TaxID=56458 RepID=UPI003B224B9C
MGGFSIWHWLVLMVMLGIPLLIGVVVWMTIRAQRRRPAAVAPPLPPAASVEQRLRALEQLKAQGLIDAAEYARRREQILATL